MSSANFSAARRGRAVHMLRAKSAQLEVLSGRAQLLYAVSLLVADGRDIATKSDMAKALDDPSTLQVARSLLAEARS